MPGKKKSAERQSPPQELEESPRSELYPLVKKKAQSLVVHHIARKWEILQNHEKAGSQYPASHGSNRQGEIHLVSSREGGRTDFIY